MIDRETLIPLLACIGLTGILSVWFWLRASERSAGAASTVRVEQLVRTASTSSGDPILAPRGPLEMIVSRYRIASRAALPVHKHPYPRYGYILSGSLSVTNTETGRSRQFNAGDFIVEDVGKWHEARNLDVQPVELLVFDMVKPGTSNLVRR